VPISLLITKLYIPPARSELVPRPRVIQRLNAGLERRLTFISAPAGYGKTTLVAQWAHGLQRPVAWLSLDEGDNDGVRFFTYLVTALQTVKSNIGSAVQGSLQLPQLPPAESLTTALINDIAAHPAPFVLVLDDYHLIGELSVHEVVGFLLEHQPPQMHVVIATREDPPLPLPRLRARGQMTELRAGDLRFTAVEAADFLNRVMRLKLKAEDLAALEARTEGWIAGLQLAALSLQKQANLSEFVQRFAGDDRLVMDYLADEVLAHQPEAIQRFLLQSSILERLSGPLCDAVVAGDLSTDGDRSLDESAPLRGSQYILERLEQANLFLVPLDNRRAWYRYHHLFADLLRHRLRHAVGDRGLALLHRRASEWHRQNGTVGEAITHALAASDLDSAADLIERHAGDLIHHSQTITLHGWLEALPEEVIRTHPWLCIHYAWVLLLRGRATAEAIGRWLEDAEKALSVSPRPPRETDVSLQAAAAEEIAVIRACLARMPRHDPQATVALSLQVLGRLAKDDWVRRAALLYNLGWGHLRLGDTAAAVRAFDDARRAAQSGGSYYLGVLAADAEVAIACRQGRLREAAATCRKGLGDMVEPIERTGRPLPISGALTISLGRIVLEQGDLEGAGRLLAEGLRRIQGTLELGGWARGYAALARLRQAQGDATGALHSIERIEKLWPEMESDTYAAALRVRLWLWQSQNDPQLLMRAERDAREILPHFDDGKDIPACADEWRYARCTALVQLRIAQRRARGQPDLGPVLDFLARQLRVHEEGGWSECVIELLALRALALDAQGKTHRALDDVRRALALAEPEGYLRIFVDEGPPMARLLYEAAARGIMPEYAGRLLAAFSAAEPPRDGLLRGADTGAGMVEPLSGRELEVLGLVAEGLSNREIAQTLVISPKTVKRHTSSIYGKLGVHSRTQAVAKARVLGILPVDRV